MKLWQPESSQSLTLTQSNEYWAPTIPKARVILHDRGGPKMWQKPLLWDPSLRTILLGFFFFNFATKQKLYISNKETKSCPIFSEEVAR